MLLCARMPSPDSTCGICYEQDFERILYFKHTGCSKCVMGVNNCPYCRKDRDYPLVSYSSGRNMTSRLNFTLGSASGTLCTLPSILQYLSSSVNLLSCAEVYHGSEVHNVLCYIISCTRPGYPFRKRKLPCVSVFIRAILFSCYL